MRLMNGCAFALALTLCSSAAAFAQDAAMPVKDGGIFAKGWAGKIDAQEEKNGATLNQSRIEEKGGTFTVRTGCSAKFTFGCSWPTASVTRADRGSDGCVMTSVTPSAGSPRRREAKK
mgnify:CR=1 FL=1